MEKSKMSKKQQERREQIVKRLTAAGWTDGAENKFYSMDIPVAHEAVMEFAGKMQLTVSYTAKEETLTLIMETSLGGPGVTLIMKCWEALDEVLDLIVSFQRKVTKANFRDYVVQLVEICPGTLSDTEDGYVRLDNAAPRKKKTTTKKTTTKKSSTKKAK